MVCAFYLSAILIQWRRVILNNDSLSVNVGEKETMGMIKWGVCIVACAVIGAAGLWLATRNVPDSYVATRQMYIGNKQTTGDIGRFNADSLLIKSYLKAAKDSKIVDEVQGRLAKRGAHLSRQQLREMVTFEQDLNTLIVDLSAKAETAELAASLTNTYVEVFAEVAPTLMADMPQPELLSATRPSEAENVALYETKKVLVYGGTIGAAVGALFMFWRRVVRETCQQRRTRTSRVQG